jgi:hypothetical protein
VPLCKWCNGQENKDFYFQRDTQAIQLAGFYFNEKAEDYRQGFENDFASKYPQYIRRPLSTTHANRMG